MSGVCIHERLIYSDYQHPLRTETCLSKQQASDGLIPFSGLLKPREPLSFSLDRRRLEPELILEQ